MKDKLKQIRATFREVGLKGTVARLGWSSLLGVIAFYLVRDTLLYIGLPLLVRAIAMK